MRNIGGMIPRMCAMVMVVVMMVLLVYMIASRSSIRMMNMDMVVAS